MFKYKPVKEHVIERRIKAKQGRFAFHQVSGVLPYMLEFPYDVEDSVFIHLRENPPIFLNRISIESYLLFPETGKSNFISGLFNIAGVIEVSCKSYRIWLKKAPAFDWEEITLAVIDYLRIELKKADILQLPGSANPDGSGGITREEPSRKLI